MSNSINCWHASPADEVILNTHGYYNNDGNDMLVLASAAKSGAVLTARIAVEVCVLCILWYTIVAFRPV